jgi:hypothetical protein
MTKTIEMCDHSEQTTARAARPRRRWPLAVGIVALLGVGGASVAAAADPGGRTPLERPDLRNPTVLREAHTRLQIAEWAAANHVTGLSPASLRPLPHPAYQPSRFGPR